MSVTADLDRPTWGEALRLLGEALDLPQAQRAAWLAALTHPSSAVLTLVGRLLAERGAIETASFLEGGAPLPEWNETTFEAGQLVGPYRLVRSLGRGGTAVVWLAERADEAHRRPVALKLPMIDHLRAQVISARFLRERVILSGLVHPHIASVLDAGSDGHQPWLAMEFVDGTTLTAYCDTAHLDLHARLRLFVEVLRAVQYAHAQGVIHRDIKPANVLVDRDGRVKLVDFGIAKLLSESGEGTMTRWAGRALTPDYASPEQLAGETVGTDSDVYSLGLVLYEVLVGERLRTGVAIEARRPSRAVREEGGAGSRRARALQGDLDTIVVKALQRVRSDRYATVAAFAEDIERHLAQRPILARPDSAWYRAAKFTSRHRLGVALSACIAVALAGALGVALWQARVARVEGGRALATKKFLVGLFDNSARQGAPGTPAYQVTGKELLEVGTKRLLTDYKEPTELRLELLTLLGSLSEELDLLPQAQALTDEATTLSRTLHGEHDVRYAQALLAAAEVKVRASDYPTALDEGGRALALFRSAGAAQAERIGQGEILLGNALDQLERDDESRAHLQAAVDVLAKADSKTEQRSRASFYLARAYEASGDLARAEALYRDGIAQAERNFGPRSYIAAFGYENFGDLLRQQSRFDEAQDLLQRSLEIYAVVLGPDHLNVAGARYELAQVHAATGDRDVAQQMMADAIALSDRVAGPFQPNAGGYQMGRRAALLLAMGDLVHSKALYDQVLGHWPRGDALRAQRISVLGLGASRLLIAEGDYAGAAALLDEVDEALAAKPLDDRYAAPERVIAVARRAAIAFAQGDRARARALIDDALGRPIPTSADDWSAPIALVEVLNRTHPARATAQAVLAKVAALGDPSAYARRDVENRARLDLALGQLSFDAGDAEAARSRLQEAVDLRARIDVPDSPWRAEAELSLATCLTALGRAEAARPLVDHAMQVLAAYPRLRATVRPPKP
jgi:eukaryotic-like serine/threonine-protein kinase